MILKIRRHEGLKWETFYVCDVVVYAHSPGYELQVRATDQNDLTEQRTVSIIEVRDTVSR